MNERNRFLYAIIDQECRQNWGKSTVSVRMSRIAKKLSKIELLDLSPLRPFTQQGLTNALLFVGSLSIWSLMTLETGFRQIMWIMVGMALIVSGLALLSPVYGVHKRIVQSKGDELSWVNTRISRLRDSLQNSDIARGGSEMAGLVAYRGLVEAVPEWPFTASSYTGIILYALLPIATWSIGLIAEEIIGRMLL